MLCTILVCGRIWSLQHETQYRTGLHHLVGDKDVGISARSEATAASSVATEGPEMRMMAVKAYARLKQTVLLKASVCVRLPARPSQQFIPLGGLPLGPCWQCPSLSWHAEEESAYEFVAWQIVNWKLCWWSLNKRQLKKQSEHECRLFELSTYII